MMLTTTIVDPVSSIPPPLSRIVPLSAPALEPTLDSTIRALDAALHARDIDTHSHSQRVIYYSLTLGRMLGLSEDELLTLERGAFLHDIGKIHVPDCVLLKPGQLTEAEWTVMRRHPAIGFDMLRFSPLLADAAKIVLAHHERYDGTGYPFGLRGETIPLGARICALADVFDAITTARPYRAAMSLSDAYEYIRSQSGTFFDPQIVDVFSVLPPFEWQRIQEAALRPFELLIA